MPNSSLLSMVLLVCLNSAHGASWNSRCGNSELQYDEQIWTVVGEWHSPEDVSLTLIDHDDGAVFMIRFEPFDAITEVSDLEIESALSEVISDPKFQAQKLHRATANISGRRIDYVEYLIQNHKFGEQVLRQYYFGEADAVTILQLSWPSTLPRNKREVPTKHADLLAGLTLRPHQSERCTDPPK